LEVGTQVGDILLANIGSSSHRYALATPDGIAATAHAERAGSGYRWKSSLITEGGAPLSLDGFTRSAARFLEGLEESSLIGSASDIQAIGLRVVAPGSGFQQHRLLDKPYLEALERAKDYAPLHIAPVLEEAGFLGRLLPDIPIAAISDSAFHKTIPPSSRTYALPVEDAERLDLFRFGYHGISAQSILRRIRNTKGTVPSRIILCHLGSGASVMAVKDGSSLEASMGFSPLEGLVMGTRVGDIDPSAVLHLLKTSGMGLDGLDTFLNSKCGLRGLSGRTQDMRELLALEAEGDGRARLAVETFVARVKKYVGGYAALLGGLDLLIFTAGIGDSSPVVRERICRGLEWMGVRLDPARNRDAIRKDAAIHKEGSKVAVEVIPPRELEEMAAQTRALVP
jgi:acetate kinase